MIEEILVVKNEKIDFFYGYLQSFGGVLHYAWMKKFKVTKEF